MMRNTNPILPRGWLVRRCRLRYPIIVIGVIGPEFVIGLQLASESDENGSVDGSVDLRNELLWIVGDFATRA
jgi:hypothetical protein